MRFDEHRARPSCRRGGRGWPQNGVLLAAAGVLLARAAATRRRTRRPARPPPRSTRTRSPSTRSTSCCSSSAAEARAGRGRQPPDPGAPDRPGTRAAEGRRAQARPRPACRAAARSRQARNHRPRLPGKVGEARRKPSADEIKKYYDESRRCSRNGASTACRKSPSRPSPSRSPSCARKLARGEERSTSSSNS